MTRKQAKLLFFIARYQERNKGASPSVREMRYALGIRSHSATTAMLKRLQRDGRIQRRYGAHRSIRIVSREEGVRGMIWGCVSCLTHKIGGRSTFSTAEFHTITVSASQPKCRTCSAEMAPLEFSDGRTMRIAKNAVHGASPKTSSGGSAQSQHDHCPGL